MTNLPFINACLNGLATVLLLCGWIAIRSGNRKGHAAFMISALAASAAFLVCYLTWHGWLVKHTGKGHVPFTAEGTVRVVSPTVQVHADTRGGRIKRRIEYTP